MKSLVINVVERHPKLLELKKYWQENKEKKSILGMWNDYIGEFFEFKLNAKNFWYKVVRKWEQESAVPDDIDITKLKKENRAVAVELLGKKLKELNNNPRKFNKAALTDITRLYKIIREEEDRETRMALDRDQKKKENVLNLLQLAIQYGKISPEDIRKLYDAKILLPSKPTDGTEEVPASGGIGDSEGQN